MVILDSLGKLSLDLLDERLQVCVAPQQVILERFVFGGVVFNLD